MSGGISRHGHDEANYDARPCSFLFPPRAKTSVAMQHVFYDNRELILSCDALTAGSMPFFLEG